MKNIIYTLIFTLTLLVGTTYALELQDAKKQGLVGETASGYLAPVSNNEQIVLDLVSDINAKRKAHYQGIAKDNTTPLQTVEQLAGKKAMAKTPSGQYVDDGSGWQKK